MEKIKRGIKSRKSVVIDEDKHTIIKTLASRKKKRFEEELDEVVSLGLEQITDNSESINKKKKNS